MPINGVVETATGDLIRAGYTDFENDGTFDPLTETYLTNVPVPAFVRRIGRGGRMHRWNGSSWALVPQPQPPTSANSAGEQGTTSTTYLQKVSLSLVADGEEWDVSWSAEFDADVGGRAMLRVQLDNLTDLAEVTTKPDTPASGGWDSFAGTARITLAEGLHTLDLDWAATVASKEARIRNATITARRV